MVPGTELIATAQYGQYLQDLAHETQDNWLINSMIDFSIESRILTAYTAFMIPDIEAASVESEFSDESNGGRNDWDNGGATGIEDEADADTTLELLATPNPFNPVTTFNIHVPPKYAGSDLELYIFNILGQRVKTFVRQAPTAGDYRITWNAVSDSDRPIASGTYFAVMRIKDAVVKQKLLYLK